MARSERHPSNPKLNWRLTLKSASRDPLYISLLALPLMWTALIASSLWWNLDQLHTTVQDLALTAARASFQKDILIRQWASNHGGVYVPVTDQTPPNPYLTNIPERDITTPSGRLLTLLNPAYITRQLYELGQQSDQPSGHITSLNPIRPANAPDDWERQALEAFERGTTEVSAISELGGEKYLRLMHPLVTAASCLKCHAAQGYQEGDIRGGISVAVSMQQYATIVSPYQRNAVLLHGGLWGVGLGLILAASGQLRRRRRERAQIEAVLRDNQARLQRAESVAHFGNWAFNLNDRSVDVSPGARLIYGLQGEAWSVAEVQNIPLPEYRPALDAALSNLIEHNQPYDLEFRIRRPSDGQLRDIHSIAEYDPERRIVLGVIHDITARKQIETALQISLTKYQTLFEALPLGVTVADRAGQITESNQAASQMLGLSQAAQHQRQINDQARHLIRPDGSPMAPEELAGARALKEQRQVTNVEMGLVRDDGRTTWVSATAAPLALAEQGVIVAYMDITERKRVEADLLEHRANLSALIENTDGSIWAVDDHYRLIVGNALFKRNVAAGECVLLSNLPTEAKAEWQGYYDRALHGEGFSIETVTRFRPIPEYIEYHFNPIVAADGHITGVTVFGRDITQRKRAEEALRASEARWHSVIKASPDGICLATLDGVIQYASDKLLALHGYQQMTELLGQNVFEFLDADYHEQASSRINKMLKGIYSGVMEYEVIKHDGSTFFADINAEVLRDAAGQPVGLLLIERDVTARKQAEAALRESEEKFRAMADLLPQIVFESDVQGRLTYVNKQALRVLGYPADYEITGFNTLSLYIPEDRGRAIDNVKRRMQGQPEDSHEYTMIRYDGSLINVLVYSNPIIKDSQQVGLRGIIVDITDRKRAEAALRESERRFRDMMEQVQLCSATLDIQGNITFVNDYLLNLTGWQRAEVMGRNWFDCFIPPQAAVRQDLFQGLPEDTVPVHYENEILTRSGERRLIAWSNSVVHDASGGIAGVAGIGVDITDRKRAEAALHDLNTTLEQRVIERTAELQAANRRLTELDRLKDEFLSRISHELRTPLTSIKIYIELLETAKPEKREVYLQTLKYEADRLHTLIEEVLAFSQVNLNPEPALLSSLDLNNLIEGRLTTWQKLSAGHALEFRLNLAQNLPRVQVDSELLMQALARLITNAVNYTPAGSVTVSTARTDENNQSWITISVKDTGPGITPEDLPHIFERFYRGRTAADYKTPGVGVGLSISREIAEKLGGRLTVETQVGAGSTFTIWLPAA